MVVQCRWIQVDLPKWQSFWSKIPSLFFPKKMKILCLFLVAGKHDLHTVYNKPGWSILVHLVHIEYVKMLRRDLCMSRMNGRSYYSKKIPHMGSCLLFYDILENCEHTL